MSSILRDAEHAALSKLTLSGAVLDLGGSKKSAYQKIFRGDYMLTTVNLDPGAEPDVAHDLEKPLPFQEVSYDAVLLINVLEHVYRARELLADSTRVLKPGGTLIIVVPFLFPVHPSPEDFWRFTESALVRLLTEAWLKDIRIESLGSGVCAARMLFIERLLPAPLQRVTTLLHPLVTLTDRAFTSLARVLGKQYRPKDYPLGYLAVAKKV